MSFGERLLFISKEVTTRTIFVVPDTNVLWDQLADLMRVLKPFQKDVIVAIPQIPVDELLKPPKGRPRRRLYRLACLEEDRTDEFLKNIETIEREIAAKGFKTELAPIPFTTGIARLGYGHLIDSEGELMLSKIIRLLVGKGGRYYPTLRQIAQCVQRIKQQPLVENRGVENIDKVFWELLGQCCSIPRDKHQCIEQCERFFNVLGDILIVGSAIRLARNYKDAEVFLVTNNIADICSVIDRLRQEQPTNEIQRIHCGTLKDLESFVKSTRGDQKTY